MGSQRVQHNRAHTRTLVGNMVNFSVCDSFIYNIWHMIKKLQVIEKASMVEQCPPKDVSVLILRICRDSADVIQDLEMERVLWLIQGGPLKSQGQSQ